MTFFFRNILILLIFIVGGTLFFYLPLPETAVKTLLSEAHSISPELLQAERTYWRSKIDILGVEKAYAQFKDTYEKRHFEDQHTVAHIIGELIYEKKGIEGLVICDDSFAFGCYHSFFTRAISENGIEILPALDSACVKEYGRYGTGCQHGIGHGVMEYIGPERLVEGLEACTLTTQVKDLFGCTSGLFMEYNTSTIFTPDSVYQKDRKFNQKNPYEPCSTTVPSEFRNSCYFELSQWWKNILGEDYGQIGSLCNDIGNQKNKESCYMGFGTVAGPSADYDTAGTIKICNDMPTEEGIFFCRAGASWVFFANPEYRARAPALCEGFNKKEEEEFCLQKSDLIGTGEKNA